MNFNRVLGLILILWIGVRAPGAADVKVDDAFTRTEAGGNSWTIGTGAIQWTLENKDGQLRLVSYQNKLVSPAREYINPSEAAAPFALDTSIFAHYATEPLWEKKLNVGSRIDLSADKLSLQVKAGDMIAFAVAARGEYCFAPTEWNTTIQYAGGKAYASIEDKKLDQGPIWYYFIHAPGTGLMQPIDVIEPYQPWWLVNPKESVRMPSDKTGLKSWGPVPYVGATKFHPALNMDIARVWCAPTSGTVTMGGVASGNSNPVTLKIFRIREIPGGDQAAPGDSAWKVASAAGQQVMVGGRQAVQLDLDLRRDALHARLHLQAFPRSPILRQWVEVENTGTTPCKLKTPASLALKLRGDDATSITHSWMTGGNSLPNQGMLESAPLASPYHKEIIGKRTDNFTPWMALQRSGGARDGWFTMLEYLGTWRMALDHTTGNSAWLAASIPELTGRELAPGEKLQLPLVTLGVFRKDLDDMGERVYNWQYEYLWDYTHDDWYAKMQMSPAWYNDVRNLHENFAGRLADLDMNAADDARETGMEIVWDDAGWSESPNIWSPSREGPDFSQTQRYLQKMGIKWTLWFCHLPTAGLMDSKVGAWGDFQWRTDGQGEFDITLDRSWREKVMRFLTIHPRSSFHTCDGGSRYAHTFEIQRLADTNMLCDPGCGDQTNYYHSYFDTADKWNDVIPPMQIAGKYYPETTRKMLTMTPAWYGRAVGEDREQVRRMAEIYHYLLREGVAGRWSYTFHPEVKGDKAFYYVQRTSYDHKKACIVFKHQAKGDVTLYPSNLIPDHAYTVGFDSTRETSTRSGADLTSNGITIKNQAPGELIYLGLPNRPGGGLDKQAPSAPGSALIRRETNIGHTGISIYWSAGTDDNWISYYEVRRNETILGRASIGACFFDHAKGWDLKANYAVRAVDGDGNVSPWTVANPCSSEALEFCALGGLFSEAGREGWRGETSSDGQTFQPMPNFINPAKKPYFEIANGLGSANQPGGAEGYWEGAVTARVGRGWQQASTSAQCVRAWVAPQEGTVRILGRVMKEYYRNAQGGPLKVRILQNKKQAWPAQGWGEIKPGDLAGLTYDFKIKVAKGDAIRFVLDRVAAPAGAKKTAASGPAATGINVQMAPVAAGAVPEHSTSPDCDIVGWIPRIIYEEKEPVASPQLDVVRIKCGGEKPWTDSAGNVWSADRDYQGGEPIVDISSASVMDALPAPADQGLYFGGRQGESFSYAIPLKPGLYTLRLKFAEREFKQFFERPMSLNVNGRPVMSDFDVCQTARGANRACERVFRYLVPDDKGLLVLAFRGGNTPLQRSRKAMVQAIEILPEIRPAVRIDVGAEQPFVDWNGFVWSADTGSDSGPQRAWGGQGQPGYADPARPVALPERSGGPAPDLHGDRVAGALHGAPQVRGALDASARSAPDGYRGQWPACLDGVGSGNGGRADRHGD